MDQEFLGLLTAASEAQLARTLPAGTDPRRVGREVRRLVAGYVGESKYRDDPAILKRLQQLSSELAERQHADGTYDIGNLHSPPDTAFLIQDLCVVWELLAGNEPAATVRSVVHKILEKAGPALASGGVHTPNHRWEVSAALARINHILPDQRYVDRIDEWLAEGIDAGPDGIYSERSAIYAAAVTNPSLLTIAWLQGRPELIDFVRRNLEATLYLLEPNGEVDVIASRRQDQLHIREVSDYLLQFRELALLDGDGRFAAVARGIERRGDGELGDFLAEVLERPELAAPLPQATEPPTEFVQEFPSQASVRIRRGSRTATIFGGSDVPEVGAIASGLSINPTFFKLRQGDAILDSVRLAPQFFGTGHFHSEYLRRWSPSVVELGAEVAAPYYQPLPPERRTADGRYALTPDGRFYAAMDFGQRSKDYRTLRTAITVAEVENGFDLTFELAGSEAPYAIELCFRPGGVLSGVVAIEGSDNYQLESGIGVYAVGNDRIEFGPGTGTARVAMDPGERYRMLNGSLMPDGLRVYLTGSAPCRQRLEIRTA
ncbi:hypothetical protein E1263_28115 [Kribbella antibiotica]|uniref:Heparinase n=1 Tax=Kribbella antibiotica TaxID=190195 RepID=A0A4R4Z809_9ACTN|nr:hypothetical protein [Kribbella antibiotica]TDD53294.1 hypothetical protein E1263_28115 [Kribbella antibiotica]